MRLPRAPELIGPAGCGGDPEVMLATGAMLVGRGTYEVAKRMSDEATDYDGGPVFVLTHQPPAEPDQGVTFLTCDLAEAVTTARRRGREEPGDSRCRPGQSVPAARARRRGPGVCPASAARRWLRFSTSGLGRIDLEPFSNTQSGSVTMLRFRVRK